MKKILTALMAITSISAFANIGGADSPKDADLKKDLIVCYNSDLRGDYFYPPIVSTLVISPEVNGKRYFTSWVGDKKAGGSFTAIGPRELQSFSISDQGIEVRFPEQSNSLSYRYQSVRAASKGDAFIKFQNEEQNQVEIVYPQGGLLKSLKKYAQVSCYFKRTEFVTIGDDVAKVMIDSDYVQSFDLVDGVGENPSVARDLQVPLLVKFLKAL